MKYTIKSVDIENNTFEALMMSLAQHGSSTFEVVTESETRRIVKFASGVSVICDFTEGSNLDAVPYVDDEYAFEIQGADEEAFSM